MRVLIVGTIPPPGGESARLLAADAARRIAEGDEVEVLSPNVLSAADRHVRLDGLFLPAQLLYLAPRFDAVVLRIERDLPLSAEAGRGSRALYLGALGLALSRYREVTLRLDSPVPLPGGLGGRATRSLWSAATTIVIADEADRKMLLDVPGMKPERILLEEPNDATRVAGDLWPAATDPHLRESVLELVRSKAARDRAVARARISLGAAVGPPPASALLAANGSVRPSLKGSASLLARRTLSKARSLVSA